MAIQAAAVCSSLYVVNYKTNTIEQKQSRHLCAIFTCFIESNIRTVEPNFEAPMKTIPGGDGLAKQPKNGFS